ncbi:hypothetical protein, partial [Enterobacter ludwigii]|uniref:hypothetical protein n=1 Tax=Enterobacter ludwigii TaxID=299767 RepID=UPI001C8B7FBE
LINNILWYSTGWVFFGLIVLSGIAGGLAASVLHFTTTDAFLAAFCLFLLLSLPVCFWLHRLSRIHRRQ